MLVLLLVLQANMTQTESGQCCCNDTWFQFWRQMFCDQSNSDVYNCHDENSQWHPINGCTSRVERRSRNGSPRLQWMFWEQQHRFNIYLQAMQLGEKIWVQQTPRFITSLVIKLVTDKTSSLLWHNSSGKIPPLDCPRDQNDSQRLPTFLPVDLCFNLRFWCIN